VLAHLNLLEFLQVVTLSGNGNRNDISKKNNKIEKISEVSDSEIESWAESYEEQNTDSENSYGFWFEEIHTTPGQRRQLIRQKVEDKEPTFGNIVLASLMANGNVPLTLTPNFDDLVYDALYRFLEEKPLVINHDAVAAEFSLTKERPMIIKLHGDYLFENLQNLDDETEKLQANMQRAFSLALNEYGLVVVGYGGNDKSIMDEVLLDDIKVPEYGIYWCARDRSELSEKVNRLLEKENTYFVNINGSESFFTKLANRITGVSPPGEEDLRENAEKKIEAMKRTIEQREQEAESQEEEEYMDTLQYKSKARELAHKEEWEELLEVSSELTSVAPDDPVGHFHQGFALQKLGKYEEAIDRYEIAVRYEPRDVVAYTNRSECCLIVSKYKSARDDAGKAYEISENTEDKAISLMLLIISKTMIDEDLNSLEQEYREICEEDFTTRWDSTGLKKWLNETDMTVEVEEYAFETVRSLEKHAEDN
jgi:tetratricopeptide (TPR) repeat protein